MPRSESSALKSEIAVHIPQLSREDACRYVFFQAVSGVIGDAIPMYDRDPYTKGELEMVKTRYEGYAWDMYDSHIASAAAYGQEAYADIIGNPDAPVGRAVAWNRERSGEVYAHAGRGKTLLDANIEQFNRGKKVDKHVREAIRPFFKGGVGRWLARQGIGHGGIYVIDEEALEREISPDTRKMVHEYRQMIDAQLEGADPSSIGDPISIAQQEISSVLRRGEVVHRQIMEELEKHHFTFTWKEGRGLFKKTVDCSTIVDRNDPDTYSELFRIVCNCIAHNGVCLRLNDAIDELRQTEWVDDDGYLIRLQYFENDGTPVWVYPSDI